MRPLSRLAIKTASLSVAAAVATIAFVAVAREVVAGNADAFDREVELAVHRTGTPTLDAIAAVVTDAGWWPVIAILVAATSAWAVHAGRRRIALVLIINSVVVELVNGLLKLAFQRTRPALFALIRFPGGYSFPSGHAMAATAAYGALAAAVIELAPRLRWLAITTAMLVILVVGCSRVYLGVHWPSDIVAGYAAAIPLLAVSIHLMHDGRRLDRPE